MHTTRIAIVNKLSNSELRKDVASGKTFLVRCEEVKSKRGGKPYFDLIDVEVPQGKLA